MLPNTFWSNIQENNTTNANTNTYTNDNTIKKELYFFYQANHDAALRPKQLFDNIFLLRTVSTIVTAHTFCASPDTRISYHQCLLIQGYFCAA